MGSFKQFVDVNEIDEKFRGKCWMRNYEDVKVAFKRAPGEFWLQTK